MKQWILVSCFLGLCAAMPRFGQYGRLSPNIPNELPQYSAQPSSYADLLRRMWLHNFLPSHSSIYWMRQRPQERDTQQFYEYSMPVHPPPLPSQQTPLFPQNPHLQEQIPFNLIPTRQVQLQQYGLQPPLQPQPFPLPEGNPPVIQQQLLPPSDRQTQQVPVQEYSGAIAQAFYPSLHGIQQDQAQHPQQRSIYPSLYYLPYVANQGGVPIRLGIVSSEEMQGGALGAPAYRAMGPNVFAFGSGFPNMAETRGQPGDFTVEDDQLIPTSKPVIQGAANQAANPSGSGSTVNHANGNQGGAFPNANSNLLNPAAQSKGLSSIPQATASPVATPGFPDSYLPFDADTNLPVEPTMFPNSMYTPQGGSEAGQPPVVQDGWHFQEP